MASRSSPFHASLHRPRLIMGVEKASFGALAMAASFSVVAQSYWGIPIVLMLYLLARWLSKRDDQFLAILARYLDEGHVYDATPRLSDFENRPKGWGKGPPALITCKAHMVSLEESVCQAAQGRAFVWRLVAVVLDSRGRD